MPIFQVGPSKWSTRPPNPQRARSDLPCPNIISDEMPSTEQVDGVFYTSKSKFRAVGRALGLTEVGTAKFPARQRPSAGRENKAKRMAALQKAIAQHKAGRRAHA